MEEQKRQDSTADIVSRGEKELMLESFVSLLGRERKLEREST